MAPTIKARDDVDGCGCLECRNVETTTIDRTVLDALVWSARLFRSYPSIVAFAGVIVVTERLLETGALAALPTPAVGAVEAVTAFAFVVSIRAYVATIVAGELTGDSVAMREGLRRSVARTPALVGVLLLVVLSVMTVPSVVAVPLVLLVGAMPATPVETVGFPVVAAVGGTVFAVPFFFLLFKFWFAPEACVIGRYGPLESLRVSWRITTNYRGKFLLVAVIAAGNAIGFYLSAVLPELGTGLAVVHPVLGVISSSVGELLSVVWASAYAHVYVQGIVS
ncbi:hypothetical protein ACFPM1_08015 [Halorubrum rubrum]|uniref:DUF7847 domain-containing protein n=1 Tax=Halorubrum rubrum TaxID=1126240 RepID=A0ABD5R125_9EURY|nr:hypothetical protein [Halorubrum rubrum]